MQPTPDTQDSEHVLTASGEFDVHDEPIDLGIYRFEDWISFGFFWLLAGTVFLQFFTRYALNDSAGWTEEIARYLLICTVFIGAAVSVRKNNHIHVDFLCRYLPGKAGRALATLVDLLRIAFLGACVVLTAQMMMKMGDYKMTVIEAPMNIVYGVCLAGFAAMLLRRSRRSARASAWWGAWNHRSTSRPVSRTSSNRRRCDGPRPSGSSPQKSWPLDLRRACSIPACMHATRFAVRVRENGSITCSLRACLRWVASASRRCSILRGA